MITPRRTRLVRVADLRAFRAAIAHLVGGASLPHESIIVVPTRGAAAQLDCGGIALTRDELYDRLHARLAGAPRRLTALERSVVAQASARAAAAGHPVGFRLRAGLVGEMLRFYDQLRRQSQQVDRFEELIAAALGADEIDRGASRMRQQTAFLASAFREYERRVSDSGACDEHQLRARLIAESAVDPVRHVVVTTADWIAEPDGLFVADFDLLARLPGLASIDIVATDALLGSGFHERIHDWLPGIEEIQAPSPQPSIAKPRLVVPPEAPPDEPWWTCRDREEELVAIARRLKADRRAGEAAPLDRTAVVFKRPLPYLYLARSVFGSAGIPYRTFDALPLAAEPTAASIDLILEAVASHFTRDSIVALLRSPHLRFTSNGIELTRWSIGALDRFLSEKRYLGDRSRLESLAELARLGDAEPALDAAIDAAVTLAPLTEPAPASVHLRCLLGWWEGRLRALDDAAPHAARERRARAAIVDTLDSLAGVHEAHDDPLWAIDDLALAVRLAIEDQTFEPGAAAAGVRLLDDRAARYADFDDVTIVGLVEQEWPERPRRNIFYPPALLKSLGWPSEKDRKAAADSRFLDLLAAAARRTAISVFTLDDDAIVSRSLQLDEVPRGRLSTVAQQVQSDVRIFVDEALSLEPVTLDPLDAAAKDWAGLRIARTPESDARYHGAVDAGTPRAWSVSALETYLGCPFRFFAQHVLRLREEPEDEEIMDPRRQGEFVHGVFERFFDAWTRAGHGTITRDNLDDARRVFESVVEDEVKTLSDAEAGLERTRLLGSPAAAGLGEAVMRMEAERPTPVVERLLEHRLEGVFTFATGTGPRRVALKGKADRLDLLADGTFRLIDYKLGWPPDRRLALQLPIYGLCAEQALSARDGRPWALAEAAYIAFKGPRRVVPLFKGTEERSEVLAGAQQRLADTIDRIERGEFPPAPDDVFRCETCSYADVCRKDYIGDI